MTKVDAGRRPLGRDTSSREGRTTPHTRPLSRSTLWPRVLDVHREVAGLRSSAKQRMRLPHAHGATGASPHAIARTRMAWLCGQIPRLGPDDRADDLGRVGRGNDDIIVARMTVGYEQDRVVPLAPSADEGPPANGGDDDLTVGGGILGSHTTMKPAGNTRLMESSGITRARRLGWLARRDSGHLDAGAQSPAQRHGAMREQGDAPPHVIPRFR